MNVFKYSVKLYKQLFFLLLLKHQTCSLCISTILDCNYSGCKSQRRCCLSTSGYGAWQAYFMKSGTFSSLLENTESTHALRMTDTRLVSVSVNLAGSCIIDCLTQLSSGEQNRLSTNINHQNCLNVKNFVPHSLSLVPDSQVCHVVIV